MIRNVALGILSGEHRADAMLDTRATYCVVPPSVARLLEFNSGNRLGTRPVNVMGGQVMMDLHRLEYLKVGTALAYRVTLL